MLTSKINNFLANNQDLQTPFLVVDTDIVSQKYKEFVNSYDNKVSVYYAVKCNPAPEVLKLLDKQGSCFDVASIEEIQLCLSLGVDSSKLSWGSTIKKSSLIEKAYSLGVKMYAFDSIEELEKIEKFAPNSKVYCRIMVSNDDAQWALSKKFGCSNKMAKDLMVKASKMKLDPIGISFHVGSQQLNPDAWKEALISVAEIFKDLKNNHDINLHTINIGGGYPAYGYMGEVKNISHYSDVVLHTIKNCFEVEITLFAEPGRFMVADAGVIKSEVVLVSKKDDSAKVRWVYLDIGVFGGLAETLGECIKYKIITNQSHTETSHVAIAGPTCDGMDIMYQDFKYKLPVSLSSGDHVYILSTGAYTTTYSSVAFNGFLPLKDYYI